MRIPKPKKLPSGTWRAQTVINNRRVSVTAPTKNECQARIIELKMRTADTGQIRLSGDVSLGEAIDKYIEDRAAVLSPSTIRGYKIIRSNRFQSVMPLQISKLKNWQKIISSESKTCSAKTLRNAWGLVCAVLKYHGYDPGHVRLPLNMPNERAYLDPAQIKTFVSAIYGDRYELQYLLCLHGLRRSELLALEKSDVNGSIRISKARVPGAENRFVTKQETKNRSSARSVPVMIPRVSDLVEKRPDGIMIKTNPERMNSHLQEICEKNGLPVVTLHGLRHSFASLCYHLHVSELQCMSWGGWSDLTTMRKIYTHIAEEDSKKDAENLIAFFDS